MSYRATFRNPRAARTIRFTLIGVGLATERKPRNAGRVRNDLDYNNRLDFPQRSPHFSLCERAVKKAPRIPRIITDQSRTTSGLIKDLIRENPRKSVAGFIPRNPSQTQPDCAMQYQRAPWQSTVFDLPSKPCRQCPGESTASLPRILSGTWRQ
jgi:hypothetical protein